MTREEREFAIDIIQSILDKYEEDECLVTEITIGDEDIKALELAINALEQEPTTKNDLGVSSELEKNSKKLEKNFGELDCISRADARSLVVKIGTKDMLGMTGKTFQDLYKGIDALPSVTPQEPKPGHWIENAPEYQNIDPPYICSECGNMHLRKTNYCDQCGAKMVEPQESEDKE